MGRKQTFELHADACVFKREVLEGAETAHPGHANLPVPKKLVALAGASIMQLLGFARSDATSQSNSACTRQLDDRSAQHLPRATTI